MKLNKSITIDAGHGGHDPGALSPRGLREKDVALKVVTMTAALLTPVMGVYLTRKDDRFLELADRAAIANRNGSDFFLSVHCNSGPPGQGHGFEVFTTRGDTAADPFATALFREYVREFPTLAKRVDLSDGDEDKEADFAVLRLSRMPAALFELEFIHTERGHELLSDEAILKRMAQALARGIYRHASGGRELASPGIQMSPPTNRDALPTRVTAEDLDALLDEAETAEHVFWKKELLVSYRLKCGFTVTGRAAVVDPANFNLETGRKIARDDARNQLWPLEGYRLQWALAGMN